MGPEGQDGRMHRPQGEGRERAQRELPTSPQGSTEEVREGFLEEEEASALVLSGGRE